MQDRYTGDVGDYGKYGLLRWICRQVEEVKLGVHWYLTTPEGNNDGGRTEYLKKTERFKRFDKDLFDFLDDLVFVKNNRHVQAIEDSGILPTGTSYFNEMLAFPPQSNPTKRSMYWTGLCNRAQVKLKSANFVFFDPDDGLQCMPRPNFRRRTLKNVFEDILKPYYNEKTTLLIYNHYNHQNKNVMNDTKKILNWLAKQFPSQANGVAALTFRPYSVRTYFLIPQGKLGPPIYDAVKAFAESPKNWGQFPVEWTV